MSVKNFINGATMACAPVLVGAAGYWLAMGYYAAALAAMACVVLCMEGRVRAGYRLPRGGFFAAHIGAGVLLGAALLALAWAPMPVWMVFAAAALYACSALSGGTLLARQYVSLD